MSDYNKVILMGRLTRDPELKTVGGGNSVADIGLAVGREWKSKDGEKQKETCFVDCVAWGRTGEVMDQYLSKGDPVFIEGRLQLDQWKDKDGGNRSKIKVVIERFNFVGGSNEEKSGGNTSGGGKAQQSQRQPAGAAVGQDDIPF